MRKLNQFEVFEEKVRRMADGFRSPEIPTTQLMFRGEEMLPMQVAQRLQGILDSFQGVRDADSAHRMSMAELERAMPHHAAFYEQTVEVAKSHFGSDPRRLARFGLEVVKKPHKRHRRERSERELVTTTVVEEVSPGDGRLVELSSSSGRTRPTTWVSPTSTTWAPRWRSGQPRRASCSPLTPWVWRCECLWPTRAAM
jgi:hypothetical protein